MGDPVVVDGVESLGSVKQEEKLTHFLDHSPVKEGIYVDHVIRTKLAGQETLLSRVDVPDNRIHDGARDTGSQEPVVSVSHTEGAGVRDKAGQFLREKKKEAMVVTVRGLLTF